MLRVYDDQEALSLAAAGLFAEEARRAVEERGRCDALLSGGETPRRCYQLLGQPPLRDSIPWHGVHLFWGDERYVPHDSPLSNFGMARAALLDHLPLDAAQIHPIPYAATPRQSARAYERELRGHFGCNPPRFQLALLGLGDDGHTASLLPGSGVLRERSRWVRELYLADRDSWRVTLTTPVLNQAALVVFLVSGSGKAAVLHEVLEGASDPQRLPAQLIAPSRGRLLWLVDREAARLLSGEREEIHSN